MIPDGFHYFLDDFWNSQNFVKAGPVALPITTKLLQRIQENMETSLENMDFRNLRI